MASPLAAASSSPLSRARDNLLGTADWARASPLTLTSALLVGLVSLLILEQTVWRAKKRHLPGTQWQIPVIGQFAESLNPTFANYMRSWATPLAAVSVFNMFIVIASTTEYSRKILNSSSHTEPCLVRSAKQILLPENWVFLNGKVHNEYRKGLNRLFTRASLSIYLRVQDRIYREHFARWLADPTPDAQPYQLKFRDLNMDTSLRVFCGSYLSDEQAQIISNKYALITRALELVNFPFAFPGTKVWKACKAREVTVRFLSEAAAASKEKMAAGGEADCLLDAWVADMLAAKRWKENPDESERPSLVVRDYTDHEMALVLLSFIFASQDAMSSSLTFGFQHLADHPEVLGKVREEYLRVRGASRIEEPITLDELDEMPYAHAVVKEVLRHRPPVLMVPYLAKKPFPIDDNYTVPKGTMVIPSFWNSLHDADVYPDPDAFVPERWMPGGANASGDDSKNWLVFGAGAHKCIGYSYVMMHMSAVLGGASVLMDWTHERTALSDELVLLPTIYPADGARLKFTPRPRPSA